MKQELKKAGIGFAASRSGLQVRGIIEELPTMRALINAGNDTQACFAVLWRIRIVPLESANSAASLMTHHYHRQHRHLLELTLSRGQLSADAYALRSGVLHQLREMSPERRIILTDRRLHILTFPK